MDSIHLKTFTIVFELRYINKIKNTSYKVAALTVMPIFKYDFTVKLQG